MQTTFARLGLLAGVALASSAAWAQTAVDPPSANPPPVPTQADQTRPGQPDGAAQARTRVLPPQAVPGRGVPSDPDHYEGMIVRTPQGTFLVREPGHGDMGEAPAEDMPPESGPDEASMPGTGGPDDAAAPHPHPMPPMDAMPPHPRHPPPPGKAARFHIRSGDMDIGVKCAEDEPTKSCIDAVGGLIDKIGAAQHR